MNTCSTCHAPIRWVITPAGRRLPLDAEPVDAGTWIIERTDSQGDHAAMVDRPLAVLLDERPRYTTHFATCPQATQHRRSRR